VVSFAAVTSGEAEAGIPAAIPSHTEIPIDKAIRTKFILDLPSQKEKVQLSRCLNVPYLVRKSKSEDKIIIDNKGYH
jgi:hypothetical protein